MIKTKHGKSNFKALRPFIDAARKNDGYGKFQAAGFMDLVIEKLWYEDRFGNPVYSIAHYGKQNGDAMRDPEITFSIDWKNESIIPQTFQNDYVGVYQEVFITKNGQHLYSKRLLTDLDSFLYDWRNNIEAQGFDASKNIVAEEAAS